MRKVIAVLLIGVVGLVSTAASCGGSVKDSAGKIIITAEAALHIATDAELALRCGQPTAIPGNCISPEKHAVYKDKLLKGFALLKDANDIYNSLPPTGTPSISQITSIIAQIGAIIQEVMNGFPAVEAEKLRARPEVAKTLEVK